MAWHKALLLREHRDNEQRGWMTQIEQAGWLRTVTEGGIVVVAVVDTT